MVLVQCRARTRQRGERVMRLIVHDDSGEGSASFMEVEGGEGAVTAEEVLRQFVKLRSIRSPGVVVNECDLCLCSLSGTGADTTETLLLNNSQISVKKKGVQRFMVYGVRGQLEAHRKDVDQLRSFQSLILSLSSDIDQFVCKNDTSRAKRYRQ